MREHRYYCASHQVVERLLHNVSNQSYNVFAQPTKIDLSQL